MFKFFKKIFLLHKKKVPLEKSVNQEEDFSIDVFQLENLINNQVSFLFFNFYPDFSLESSYVSTLLKSSQPINEMVIQEKIKEMDKSKPIVLICENGDKSCKWSDILRKEGFINAFFVKGGIVALDNTSG